MTEPWVLAVDLGTGGPKTAAVSLRGNLLAHARSAVHTRYLPEGGAVQDPREWWAQIKAGIGEIVGLNRVDPEALVGMGITGQWGSTVPVDDAGEAVGECRLWADTRGRRFAAKAVGGPVSLFGYSPTNILRWVQLTGGAPSPNGADPLGHEMYMRNCEPELYARTRTFLEPIDYLGLRLTGRAVATPASMILSWLTDNRPGARPAYVPELVRRAGRDVSKLPELVATGSVIGEVLPEVARELGIRAVPVVAGVPDLHASWIGSGAVAPFQPHITISTTAWIACEVPFKKTDVLHQMASVPGVRPDQYLIANNHETAGLCLTWLRESVVDGGYDELCRMAADVAAGSGGLMFTPWLNGERTPVEDRTLRGAFLNVSLETRREQMVRAVLEGVAFNARWLFDAVERFAGRSLESLRILGGGAQSDVWCQIHADVLGRRIERVEDPMHASVRGAALFAAASLGRLTLEDVSGFVQLAGTFEPQELARSTYEPMYREFKRFYGALHGSYARLNGQVAPR